MNEKFQLKLQAYLDGELSETQIREVEAALASYSEARLMLEELKNTNRAFSIFREDLKLPESREFFWSKVEREIRSLENKSVRETRQRGFFAPFLRRIVLPVGAFAALVLIGFFTVQQTGIFSKKAQDLSSGVEIAMNDSEAFTYNDHSAGMTVVWLSYPAENEFTESPSEDTLQ